MGGQTFLGQHRILGAEEWKRWVTKESKRTQMEERGHIKLLNSSAGPGLIFVMTRKVTTSQCVYGYGYVFHIIAYSYCKNGIVIGLNFTILY